MHGAEPGDVFLADCPARLAVEVIADKWAVVVLWGLNDHARRHSELIELIGGISKKVLTQTLRRLQANGLVTRTDHGGVPPRVEYDLTDLGRTLMGPVRMLTEWAEQNGDAVLAAQDASPVPPPTARHSAGTSPHWREGHDETTSNPPLERAEALRRAPARDGGGTGDAS